MNKEEYREEVIKQLKRQNEALEAIGGAILFFAVILVLVIIVFEIFKLRQLASIAVDVDFIQSDITHIRSSVSTIETDVSLYLKNIFEKVSGIYSHAKWR